jgi:hypothetical protein
MWHSDLLISWYDACIMMGWSKVSSKLENPSKSLEWYQF